MRCERCGKDVPDLLPVRLAPDRRMLDNHPPGYLGPDDPGGEWYGREHEAPPVNPIAGWCAACVATIERDTPFLFTDR